MLTEQSLLARIVETPELAIVVPRLPADILHRVIQSAGLEDSSTLVAMATPAQIAAVFDLDLWRSAQPGKDEQFDAERFGVWLEVLLESGAEFAAGTLAGIDAGVVTAALSQFVQVFDPASLAQPEPVADDDIAGTPPAAELSAGIGGYKVVARRHDAWDATVAILIALDAGHHDYFHRVMSGSRSLSDAGREVDGLDHLLTDADQVLFDRAVEREQRREQQGYVTPAQAGAFLRMSRQLPRGARSEPPAANPIARAYFRAMEPSGDASRAGESSGGAAPSGASTTPQESAASLAAFVDLLVGAGVLPHAPRALLEGAEGRPPRLARIQAQLELARQRDENAYALRNQELGYLANVLMAGGTIQARAFTMQEAFDAAFAVCNLGLENWPRHWAAGHGGGPAKASAVLPDDFLVTHDLVGVFQVGWTVLYDDVCLFAATDLVKVLRRLRSDDRDTQADIKTLASALTRHRLAGMPWRARDAFDVIALLDTPAWAALLGLVDECPTIHGALTVSKGSRVRSVSSTAFEFIADNSQIADVHQFMATLPERFRP